MKTPSGLAGLALLAHATLRIGAAAPPIPLDSLDPQKWHEPTRARTPAMEALVGQLRLALIAEDSTRIATTVTARRRELGPEVSLPEVKLDYVGPPDLTARPIEEFLQLWLDDCQRHAGREPWDAAAAALRARRVPIRLRNSQRMADAYLDAARRKFELGVLPGQTETGRWFDPHNARTQYHAILATALSDYVELLTAIKARELDSARQAATRALDNLAAQTIAFGASNVHEMLSLEAFQRGAAVLGRHADWDRAGQITLNVLTTDLRAKIVAGTGHLPEPMPLGLLLLRPPGR